MPSDATVLGFDTSGPWIACAVVRGSVVLAHHHQDLPKGQGEALMPALQAVMDAAETDWDALDAIGCGIGPGNFTGIRITTAAARGLALGLGIPAIGIDRFEAIALDAPARPVAVPALRGQAWVRTAGQPPALTDTPPPEALTEGPHPLAVAIARLAAGRAAAPQPRPAPLYLRDADAAPPSDAPPALLD